MSDPSGVMMNGDKRYGAKIGKTWTPHKDSPIAATHPIVRELFTIARGRRVTTRALAEKIGYHEKTVYAWRQGRSPTSVHALGDLATALGYELTLTPVEPKA